MLNKIVHLGVYRKTMKRLTCITAFVMILSSCNFHAEYQTLNGFALGTTYHIVYEDPVSESLLDIPALIERTFSDINASLSVYNGESVTSKINKAATRGVKE